MDRGRLPHLIRKYQPCGKRSQGRPLKRLLDCQWEWDMSRVLKPCKLYDDDMLEGAFYTRFLNNVYMDQTSTPYF